MQYDYGSRDPEFVALAARVRHGLLALAPEASEFTAIPLQGSGTYAVEAMLGSLVPPEGGVAVLVHGVYGHRAAEILRRMGHHHTVFLAEEGDDPDLDALRVGLENDPQLTHVFTVHSETTTGQLLPVHAISVLVAKMGRRLLVDAMSSLGAISLEGVIADGIASSANKCLEGAPGLAFVLARRSALKPGFSPSLSLDLHAQESRLAKDGQYRFTPPTQVLAALDVALRLHAEEGGVAARGTRYSENMRRLLQGMSALGYRSLLPPERQGPIIATFHQPTDWDFQAFYEYLRERGFAIYPGSLARIPSFRIGCIGQVFPADIDRFLTVVAAWRGTW
jgi:2-aminoethylphosphonate-pyruvate transaminase